MHTILLDGSEKETGIIRYENTTVFSLLTGLPVVVQKPVLACECGFELFCSDRENRCECGKVYNDDGSELIDDGFIEYDY